MKSLHLHLNSLSSKYNLNQLATVNYTVINQAFTISIYSKTQQLNFLVDTSVGINQFDQLNSVFSIA